MHHVPARCFAGGPASCVAGQAARAPFLEGSPQVTRDQRSRASVQLCGRFVLIAFSAPFFAKLEIYFEFLRAVAVV